MKVRGKMIDSFEVAERVILSHKDIAYFHVLDVPVPPLLQERSQPDCLDQPALQRSLELKSRYDMSFWDAYFIAARSDPAGMPEFFRAALLHDNAASRLRQIRSQDASSKSLRQLEQSMEPGRMLALSSLVELRSGERHHIPMLDFHCAASSDNLPLVISALRALTNRGHGFLLESGKSYHYYGDQLLTLLDFPKFLARASLLGPIVDVRWVAHQILEGACALRIGHGHGYRQPPVVVADHW
jgi:hypothetical protein